VVKYSGNKKQATAPKEMSEKKIDKASLIFPSPILSFLDFFLHEIFTPMHLQYF
jgi:hypothetical protein